MPPHLVHRMVQYSEPDFPPMTRKIAMWPLQFGQLSRTAEAGGAREVSWLGICCRQFKGVKRPIVLGARLRLLRTGRA